MARISVQDCLDKIPNRFAVVMLAARRMRQLQKGSDPLIECKNKEAVTALREIAAGVVGIKELNRVQGLAESLEKTRARLLQRSTLSQNTER
jgi:DNA-directed RNA polymerase subunit omega